MHLPLNMLCLLCAQVSQGFARKTNCGDDASGDWMLSEGPHWVAVDQQTELASLYAQVVPKLNQFSVSKPFPAQASRSAEQDGPGGRKRKSRGSSKAEEQQQQEQQLDPVIPACLRHEAIVDILQGCYNEYRRTLQARNQEPLPVDQVPVRQLVDVSATKAQVEGARDSVADNVISEFALSCPGSSIITQLDLPALAALKAVVKPQFVWTRDYQGVQKPDCDLFDKLICNTSEQEAYGLAHDTRVVLPARSAFMLGDIGDINRLAQGMSLLLSMLPSG